MRPANVQALVVEYVLRIFDPSGSGLNVPSVASRATHGLREQIVIKYPRQGAGERQLWRSDLLTDQVPSIEVSSSRLRPGPRRSDASGSSTSALGGGPAVGSERSSRTSQNVRICRGKRECPRLIAVQRSSHHAVCGLSSPSDRLRINVSTRA